MIEHKGDGTLNWLLTDRVLDKYDVSRAGVLHIGAHEAEELPVYYAAMFNKIYLIEPAMNEALRTAALDTKRVLVRAVAVDDVRQPTYSEFVRTPNTHQSHLRTRADASVRTSETVYAVPLSYVQERCTANVLVVDTSGTELDVLRSGDLSLYRMIIVETDPSGEYASRHDDVVAYMRDQGFKAVERYTHGEHSYGDVVFVRPREDT